MTKFEEVAKYCGKEIEEVLEDVRKGIPQSKYVMEIEEGEYIDTDGNCQEVPESLVGYWMMEFPSDLRYKPLREAVQDYDWVRCKSVEVVNYVWEEVWQN